MGLEIPTPTPTPTYDHDNDDMPSLSDSDIESDPESAPNNAQKGTVPINNLTITEAQLLLALSAALKKPPADSEAKHSLRHRDLLPLPVPANEGIEYKGSRSVKRDACCAARMSLASCVTPSSLSTLYAWSLSQPSAIIRSRYLRPRRTS